MVRAQPAAAVGALLDGADAAPLKAAAVAWSSRGSLTSAVSEGTRPTGDMTDCDDPLLFFETDTKGDATLVAQGSDDETELESASSSDGEFD